MVAAQPSTDPARQLPVLSTAVDPAAAVLSRRRNPVSPAALADLLDWRTADALQGGSAAIRRRLRHDGAVWHRRLDAGRAVRHDAAVFHAASGSAQTTAPRAQQPNRLGTLRSVTAPVGKD